MSFVSARAQTASRRSRIDPFLVMDVLRAANARDSAAAVSGGDKVIHLEVGQPGTPAPRLAREAAIAAIESGTLGYTEALGLPALREGIRALYRSWYGLDIPTERIIVTSGSSGAFVLAYLALFDAGHGIALPSPGYPCYRHIATALDLVPIPIETTAEHRWMPSGAEMARLAARSDVHGLLLASPANPTGTMLAPERLGAIVQACDAAGLWFISDEIYHGLTYGAPQASALQFSDRAIVINSFSKYFSMTGWRIGWMVVPAELVRPIECLVQNLFICPPAVSQCAALGALGAHEELQRIRDGYARNRALLLEELPKAGLDRILPADGAFYVYADVSERTTSSRALAGRMLEEIGVAATPGLDFDAARGDRYLRFSYAGTEADIAEAARRIRGWLSQARLD